MGKIAVKVGEVFTLVPKARVQHIHLIAIKMTVNIDGVRYPIHAGLSFEDSVKIDKLMDTGKYPIYNLSEYVSW